MHNLSEKIGKKVKKLRVARGMTQAEICGDYITRNMLSRIENGAALPSLPTLLYLADKLSIDVGFLLSENADFLSMKKAAVMDTLRLHIKKEEYTQAYALYKTEFMDACDDELAFLMAHCSLFEAKRMFRFGNMRSALKELEVTEAFLNKTAYPTSSLAGEILFLRAIIENPAAPLLALSTEDYHRLSDKGSLRELYAYLSENTAYPYENAILSRHLAARALMKKNAFSDAESILLTLVEEKSGADMSAFLLYRIYTDLEASAKELRNFEAAYRYSTKRMALMSSFRT